MKHKLATMAVTGIITVTSFATMAQKPDKKAESARKEIVKDKKDLAEAKKDSISDYKEFKRESESRISKNDQNIAELKAKKASDNKDTREKYNKKVTALEEKNRELRSKMEGYSTADNNTTRWADFKRSFNQQMDELGQSISAMAQKNMNK